MPMRVKTKYRACKKNYSWNPSTCICENSKHLKHIVADSVIACDKVIYVMDIVPINMTSTIPKNISANSDDKKVIYKINCYILHTTVLLVIILLLIIAIICYHYTKHRPEQKGIDALTIQR